MKIVKQLLSLFNEREHWQLALLLAAMIVQAGAELVGVASVGPFMSVVSDPGVVERNAWLRWAYDTFGFASHTDFLIACGVAVIVVLGVTNAISAVVVWATQRFAAGAQHRLSVRLVRGYLAQPYSFFVQRNTAKLHKNVLGEVQEVIRGVLKPFLNLVARSFVTIAIIVFLIVLDPMLATVVTVVLGGTYGVIYLLIRAKQRRLGRERVDANETRYKVSGEVFGGVKDVKVLQREGSFLRLFKPASYRYARTQATYATIAYIPRYLLETVAFGGIVLIVLYYLSMGRGAGEVLPMLSLYAFAGYRLMPALQMLFASLAALRFNHAALDDVLADVALFKSEASGEEEQVEALPFQEAIRFEDVSFRYPEASEDALKAISLRINYHETVGLVGPSGSGKTTLVDLLLGLYEPGDGRIMVDGQAIDASTLAAWRRQVGYIPQDIFLTDDTIAQNVAFGVPPEELDQARVEHAARIAHIHEYVSALPDGYQTLVGERGVRLSGGQRQRVGIARALYHDPGVLIMDEATSALDGRTEDSVMEAIRKLSGQKTIVLIAHRLSTVQDCDCIYLLENGYVKDQGTFSELATSSDSFRAMAKLQRQEVA